MSANAVAIGWGYAEGHPWLVIATALAIAAFAVAFVAKRAQEHWRRRR